MYTYIYIYIYIYICSHFLLIFIVLWLKPWTPPPPLPSYHLCLLFPEPVFLCVLCTALVCDMCSLQSVMCAVFSLCYVWFFCLSSP